MRRLLLLASAVSALLVFCLLPGTAQAQQFRSFVSGTGDDGNPCTRTSPCQSWLGAFNKTAAGGEIDALDAGSFGNLVITNAITIDGGGEVAETLTAVGTQGFIISAGPSDIVTLRNLRINGFGQTNLSGLNGIEITEAGTVHIENCYIFGASKNGLVAATAANTKLVVNDTTISDNVNGIQLGPTAGDLAATFERVRIHNNSNAGVFLNPSGTGKTGVGVGRSTLTLNGIGLLVEPNGTVFLNDTEIIGNSTGVTIASGGVVNSFKNNAVGGNATNGSPLNGIALE